MRRSSSDWWHLTWHGHIGRKLWILPQLGGSPSAYCYNVWYRKLEWCGYPIVKNLWRRQNTRMRQTDTARRRMHNIVQQNVCDWPSPWRWVPIDVIIVHCFFLGSKHSTVLRVLSPSRPPTTNRRPSMTLMPNCRRRPFMLATCDQLSLRSSYFSMLIAPTQQQ